MRRQHAIVCVLTLLSALWGSGCGHGASPVAPPVSPVTTPSAGPLPATISVQDAFTLVQSNQNDGGFAILDVRTAGEFAAGHIANALNIDYYAPDFRTLVGALDRQKRYLIYCRTGIRGAAATQMMRELGFTEVQNLDGGLEQWTQAGYPTVS